tara:strand:+ start:55 stop:264 length:210 start_codon:yes stop_codon:yes gene_type:complete
MKVKVYKFKVTDEELNHIYKFHFTTEISKELGIKKGSIYNLLNNIHNNQRKKWSKYNIEKINEPYIQYN